MYEPRLVVGAFFEQKLIEIFDWKLADTKNEGEVPDLVSRDGSFFVEVKASAYNNGGVIKRTQLYTFDRSVRVRRFYAFAYHSISRLVSMAKEYPTEEKLREALDLRSLYLFPFSIVKAHFEKSRKRTNPRHDDFVQLRESLAQKIFDSDEETWARLGLPRRKYRMTQPHEKVHIITREGYLENEILESLRLERV